MSVKRIDRTLQMMREMEKSTAEALESAAIKLKAIARESVSTKYTKKSRRKVFANAQEEAKHKEWVRKKQREGFLSRKPKKKKKNGT